LAIRTSHPASSSWSCDHFRAQLQHQPRQALAIRRDRPFTQPPPLFVDGLPVQPLAAQVQADVYLHHGLLRALLGVATTSVALEEAAPAYGENGHPFMAFTP
jgi:hypothetical protein